MTKRVTKLIPTWCPGCGNIAILGAIKAALDQMGLEPSAAFVYDVGCSGNMADLFSPTVLCPARLGTAAGGRNQTTTITKSVLIIKTAAVTAKASATYFPGPWQS
jgi:pyruvate/2-oxoacid:ferredoxin oxidoreductase beta subunit